MAAVTALALAGATSQASPSIKFNEPKCGAAFYKAFAKAQGQIRKFSVKHVTTTCDGQSAAALGAELDEAIQSILDKLNKQLTKLQEEGFCDTALPFPAEAADLLKNSPDLAAFGFSTGQAFLNTEVTESCDFSPV